jgi:dihydroneopterin aldolase
MAELNMGDLDLNNPYEADRIFVEGVNQQLWFTDPAPWFGQQAQNVILSTTVFKETFNAGSADDVTKTLDYSLIYNSLLNFPKEERTDLLSHATAIAMALRKDLRETPVKRSQVTITMPKLLATAEGMLILTVGNFWENYEGGSDGSVWPKSLELKNLRTHCIIGVGELERIHKQPVVITLVLTTILGIVDTGAIAEIFDKDPHLTIVQDMLQVCFFVLIWKKATYLPVQMVKNRKFFTLEALAHSIAKMLLQQRKLNSILTIKVTKPAIFSACDGPGVMITRRPKDFGL